MWETVISGRADSTEYKHYCLVVFYALLDQKNNVRTEWIHFLSVPIPGHAVYEYLFSTEPVTKACLLPA